MASDHRGNHVHAGKRTDDEIMANPFYNAGDPLLQKATMDRMQNPNSGRAPVGKVPPMIDREGVKRAASNIAVGGTIPALVFGEVGMGYGVGNIGEDINKAHSFGIHNPVNGLIAGAIGGAAGYGLGKYLEHRDNR